MGTLKELKERVWRCNMELFKKNLVVQTFGNVSAIDRDKGILAIKPSGVPYSELSPNKIVLVDLNSKIIDKNLNPSSDTPTHIFLYNAFSEIGGIVHTHSPYATAWAQAKKPIPCLGTTHADFIQGEIPCTDELSDSQIKGNYEIETGNQIINRFKNISPSEVEMVLVAKHGPFTWGKTPMKAVYHSAVLEELAQMALFTEQINPQIGSLKTAIIDKHYQRKHGKNAYYGQN